MKTIPIFTILTLLYLNGISQTNVGKTKPASQSKPVVETSKPRKPPAGNAPKTEKEKCKKKDECKMHDKTVKENSWFYECPRCGYDSCKSGSCPRDGNKLKARFEHFSNDRILHC